MDMVFRRLIASSIHRRTAVAVVIGMLAVCVWSVVPAATMETGCRSLDHELRVCGQSVAPDQSAVATEVVPAAQWEPLLTTWEVPQQAIVAVSQFPADSSAPRAPPLS